MYVKGVHLNVTFVVVGIGVILNRNVVSLNHSWVELCVNIINRCLYYRLEVPAKEISPHVSGMKPIFLMWITLSFYFNLKDKPAHEKEEKHSDEGYTEEDEHQPQMNKQSDQESDENEADQEQLAAKENDRKNEQR